MVLQILLGAKRVDEVRRRSYTSINVRVARDVQAVSANAGFCSSGSSTSSGGENRSIRDPETEIRRLREELKRYQRVEKRQVTQCEPACEEGKLEEDGQMEVGGETESEKNLDERKKKLQKPLRDIEKFTDMNKHIVEGPKEKWQQELQDIEQRRNDLLPEHQQMQKRSQKLQSLQDTKKQCQKDAGKWDEAMERVGDEIAEREARSQELAQTNQRIRSAEKGFG